MIAVKARPEICCLIIARQIRPFCSLFPSSAPYSAALTCAYRRFLPTWTVRNSIPGSDPGCNLKGPNGSGKEAEHSRGRNILLGQWFMGPLRGRLPYVNLGGNTNSAGLPDRARHTMRPQRGGRGMRKGWVRGATQMRVRRLIVRQIGAEIWSKGMAPRPL